MLDFAAKYSVVRHVMPFGFYLSIVYFSCNLSVVGLEDNDVGGLTEIIHGDD